ncbi:hypothetical protein ACEUDR_17870 [Aeromonas veronii]
MMIYLQKRVIDQNGRSPSSFEKAKIRCGMTAEIKRGRDFAQILEFARIGLREGGPQEQ